jgi:hypothetical protein
MGSRSGLRLIGGILIVAALVGFGYYVYNLGLAQGVAEAGRISAAPSGTAPVVVMWPRPWGFGFFSFFPLLFFLLIWLFAARALFWRGGWRGRRCGYGHGSTEALDEWHRRAHAQPGVEPSPRANA